MDPLTPRPRLVLDPALPAATAQILRTSPQALHAVRAGEFPQAPRPSRRAIATVAVFALLALPPMGVLGMMAIIGVAAMFFGTQLLAEDPRSREARRRPRVAFRHADRFVLPEDLDDGCQKLLARAQKAVDDVLSSQVHTAGLLDAIDNAVTLPAEVWRLAERLADLTRTKAEHDKVVPRDVPEDIAKVFSPYDNVFTTVRASLSARVATLEEYAREVRRADAVYRAYRQLGVLRERIPDYERLLVSTVEDKLAVPPVERLSGQAREVERVFNESIDEARRAGNHLLSAA